MGISAGGGGHGPKSDMNVTPLVDVVLVLLIIFMVTMPILMRIVTVEIPRELDADEVSDIQDTTYTVTGKVDGTIEIDDGTTKQTINRVELAKFIHEKLSKRKTDKIVFVDFDDKLKYSEVVSIMDTIKGSIKTKAIDKLTGQSKLVSDVKVAIKKRTAAPGAAAQP